MFTYSSCVSLSPGGWNCSVKRELSIFTRSSYKCAFSQQLLKKETANKSLAFFLPSILLGVQKGKTSGVVRSREAGEESSGSQTGWPPGDPGLRAPKTRRVDPEAAGANWEQHQRASAGQGVGATSSSRSHQITILLISDLQTSSRSWRIRQKSSFNQRPDLEFFFSWPLYYTKRGVSLAARLKGIWTAIKRFNSIFLSKENRY